MAARRTLSLSRGKAYREFVSEAEETLERMRGALADLHFDGRLHAQSADTASFGPPRALAANAGYGAVRAVVRQPDAGPVLVLSLEHLLQSVYRSASPEAGGAP